MSRAKAKVPCHRCGTLRRRRDVDAGQACRACLQAKRQKEAAIREDARIDWGAIEWVIQLHTKKNLTPDERKIVVRHMSDRLIDDRDWRDTPKGRLTTGQLAELMGVTADCVQKIVKRLPPAVKHKCPECRGAMWVADGVVEAHGDGFLNRCPMSGRMMPRGLAAVRPDLYGWLVAS